MKKILYIELLLISIQICEQYVNYPPNYLMNRYAPPQNVHYNNYGNDHYPVRRAGYKYGPKYTRMYQEDSEYSEFSESTSSSEECSSCTCNECYKSKRCCKSTCNSCKSLLMVPYPVPFVIHEISTTEASTSTTTTKKTTTRKTTTTKITTTATQSTTTIETTTPSTTEISIEPETIISEEITKTETPEDEIETTEPPTTTELTEITDPPEPVEEQTASTIPILIPDKKKLKKVSCPPMLEGACFKKPKNLTVQRRNYNSHNIFKRPQQRVGVPKTAQNKPVIRYLTKTTEAYYISLRDIIPIPNDLAENLMFRLKKANNYYSNIEY